MRFGAEVSELPLKQYDHLMDASRYALHTALAPLPAPPTPGWNGICGGVIGYERQQPADQFPTYLCYTVHCR